MQTQCRQITSDDVEWMQTSSAQMGWAKPDGYFRRSLEQQERGEISMLVASRGDLYAGHTKIVWSPGYAYFRERDIPAIQDLAVVPRFRRQKIATALLDLAEAHVARRSKVVGIGVGLHPGYNAAQRLYVLRGYVPDGQGVIYGDDYVREGEVIRFDDDLLLHLTKDLDAHA